MGENGAGKSTMIKVLTGEVVPQTGDVWKHPNARVAYVAQHAFHHIESQLRLLSCHNIHVVYYFTSFFPFFNCSKTANEYIRWRYSGGEDKESLVKVIERCC